MRRTEACTSGLVLGSACAETGLKAVNVGHAKILKGIGLGEEGGQASGKADKSARMQLRVPSAFCPNIAHAEMTSEPCMRIGSEQNTLLRGISVSETRQGSSNE